MNLAESRLSTQAQTMLLAAGGGKSALQRLSSSGVGQGGGGGSPGPSASPLSVSYGATGAAPSSKLFGLDQNVAIGIGAAVALAIGVVVIKKLRKRKK